MDILGGPSLLSLNTLLGDAAPDLSGKTLAHFYIGVREIDAISNGQVTVLGSSATPVQMDLLAYQDGSTNWMTQTSVPAQSYSALRFVLDLSSTQAVFTDGTTAPVKFSGASTESSSGLGQTTTSTWDETYSNTIDVTVNDPFTLGSGTAAIMGDFNLSESLGEDDGSVIMRPTLTIASGAGQVSGSVLNDEGQPVVGATIVALGSNGAAVNSDTTAADGSFNIHALPAGTYRLVIYNNYTNAAGYNQSASGQTSDSWAFYGPTISVTSGTTASAGTIAD